MKLVRFGDPGREKPGVLAADGSLRDLSAIIDDLRGEWLDPQRLREIEAMEAQRLPGVHRDVRLGPPVGGTTKLVAVGLNYVDHAKEAGLALPSEPLLFMKAVSAIAGSGDAILIPRDSIKTDWELELAVVIGRLARYVKEEEALDFVAGYTICNDVSERAMQMERQGQFVKGKSADSFAPLGPWLVTQSEVPDPQNLSMWLDVNGERMQSSSTSQMIFRVPRIVSYVSEFMTLLPGDIITTGTPAGVGMGRKPPRFLKAGDEVTAGIERLGEQRQTCRPWTPELGETAARAAVNV